MEPCIMRIHGLGKQYRKFTLKPVDMEIPGGCIVGLIGENGAGKSTLMKCTLGIARRDSGSVEVFGKDMDRSEREIKQEMGVVFGDQCFPLSFTAAQVGTVMNGIFERWDQKTFDGYLERMELDRHQMIKEYSRGMRMKLNLAAAMSHHARFLMLDEPASGLDPMVREELLDILREFVADENHGVLISSHIISDIEKISDYVALLHRGELRIFREKDELIESFAILKCDLEKADALDPQTVIGMRKNSFGAEVLMRREDLPAGEPWEPANLERILIYHAKEEMR